MSEKRRGLGRGLGALIPPAPPARPVEKADRPVDVFFAEREDGEAAPAEVELPITARGSAAAKAEKSEKAGAKTGTAVATAPDDLTVDGKSAVPVQATASGPELVPVPGAYFAELPVS